MGRGGEQGAGRAQDCACTARGAVRRRRAVAAIGVAVARASSAGSASSRRFGREYKVPFEGDYYRELPSERPPAIVGYLYRSGSSGPTTWWRPSWTWRGAGHLAIREVQYEDRSLMEKFGGAYRSSTTTSIG